MKLLSLLPGLALIVLTGCTTGPRLHPPLPPAELWIDLVQGEEVSDGEVLDDLAGAGVIYLGEAHTVSRHHDLQLRLLQALFTRQLDLVLCLEQLEAGDQPAVDRFNRQEIDFDELVRVIAWEKKWRNYSDYRPLCEFARLHRIPVVALNAPSATIRSVSRGGGLDPLSRELRAQLPAEIVTEDPAYERLLGQELSVHMAVTADNLRPMFEAQVARDEAMAAAIVAARRGPGGGKRTAVVIVGAGHIRYGLGTPARVRRREPDVVERLVLFTESGQLRLSEADKAASREITITHADRRGLERPPADYLRVLPSKTAVALPPGHPPVGP